MITERIMVATAYDARCVRYACIVGAALAAALVAIIALAAIIHKPRGGRPGVDNLPLMAYHDKG